MHEQETPKPHVGSASDVHAEREALEQVTAKDTPLTDANSLNDPEQIPDPNSMHQTPFGAPPVEPPLEDNYTFKDEHQ